MQSPCMCAYSWRQRPACSSETDHDWLDAVDDHDVDCGDCDDDNHRFDNNRLQFLPATVFVPIAHCRPKYISDVPCFLQTWINLSQLFPGFT